MELRWFVTYKYIFSAVYWIIKKRGGKGLVGEDCLSFTSAVLIAAFRVNDLVFCVSSCRNLLLLF